MVHMGTIVESLLEKDTHTKLACDRYSVVDAVFLQFPPGIIEYLGEHVF